MFRSWCRTHDVVHKNNLSHVMMDGGVISIPFDKLNEFYKMYIKCIQKKEKVFVVEQKTQNFNFFMDVDYKDEEGLDVDTIKTICRVICDKVNILGGQNCLVSISEPKKKDNLVKTGIHLNWPGLVVNQQMALDIRKHVVSILSRIYSSKKWVEIIDISVYRGSGLRLPWSHKKGKHAECNGVGCVHCEEGKIVEGMYLPLYIYESLDSTVGPLKIPGKFRDVETHPTMELLEMATIRTEELAHVEIPPIKQEGSFTKTQMKNEVKISPHLETFIRLNLEGQKDARITKMFKDKMSVLVSTTSMFCENIQRNHGSNHVWFIIDKTGTISQKCFCKCDTMAGRKNGFCKDFTGRKHTLPKNIRVEMFPEENKKLNSIKAAILPNAVTNFNMPITSNSVSIYTNTF